MQHRRDLLTIALRLAPFGLALLLGLRRHPRREALFAYGWTAVAVAGVIAVGGYFDHYALPILVPLCLAGAPAFDRARIGRPFALLLLALLSAAYLVDARKLERRHGDALLAGRLRAAIAPRLSHAGCLYVFYGDPILYLQAGSCLPTRYAFPFHLALSREAAALGIDPEAEARRIVASRPAVIVDTLRPDPEINPAVARIVRGAIARDYRPVLVAPLEHGGVIVYARRLTRPPAARPR